MLNFIHGPKFSIPSEYPCAWRKFVAVDLLTFTDKGIYCAAADVYLDPWRGVERALITHAHSDHARWGSQYYLAHEHSAPALYLRLGKQIQLQTVAYNEPVYINGVQFSFHPAGHIIGSSQIRVEYKGEVWVFTGDYKLENDGFSAPFETVKCHTFITESTFGLPVYRWKPQSDIFRDIRFWWESNAAEGVCSIISAYSLGKAQRLLTHLAGDSGPIYTHTVIHAMHEALRSAGMTLPYTEKLESIKDPEHLRKALIIIPPSAAGSAALRKLEPVSEAVASGWMSIRGARRRNTIDRGFALSDHADWTALNKAVEASGASKVFVTHGYTEAFSAYLREKGLDARVARTAYNAELDDSSPEEKKLPEV